MTGVEIPADTLKSRWMACEKERLEIVAERNRLAARVKELEARVYIDGPFPCCTRVRKRSGSSWQGRIVGWYSTSLTPIGYAVESEREPGSVQIYPAAALEAVTDREAPGSPSETPS